MGLQSQWRHFFFFFSFLALFCLKQEKPDFFWIITQHFFHFFFFEEEESSKMWIEIVIFFFSFSSVRWRVRSVDPPASVSAEPQPFLFFLFFFLFMFCVADVTPRRRSGKHLFRWNRTQETRNVSAVAFLPTLPQPLSNPTIPTGRHLLSAAGARSLPASGLVRPGPPCNVNLGSSGFWQKLHTQKRKEKRPQKKTTLGLF